MNNMGAINKLIVGLHWKVDTFFSLMLFFVQEGLSTTILGLVNEPALFEQGDSIETRELVLIQYLLYPFLAPTSTYCPSLRVLIEATAFNTNADLTSPESAERRGKSWRITLALGIALSGQYRAYSFMAWQRRLPQITHTAPFHATATNGLTSSIRTLPDCRSCVRVSTLWCWCSPCRNLLEMLAWLYRSWDTSISLIRCA